MTLTIILGDVGTGKTLLLILNAILNVISGAKKQIYANFTIRLPNCQKVTVSALFTLKQGVLYIDEVYILAEARRSTSLLNQFISYVIFQSRKRELEIFVTAQLYGTFDVRLRAMAQRLIMCERLNDDFLYTFYAKKNNRWVRFARLLLLETKARLIYPYYDTLELVLPHNMLNLTYNLGDISANLDYAEALATQYLQRTHPKLLKLITHDSVYLFLKKLLKEKPPKELERDVYQFAKGKFKKKSR